MGDSSVLEAIAREMQIGVIVLDDRGSILYANPFFTRYFSNNGGLKGRMFSEFIANTALLGSVESFVADGTVAESEIEINERERVFSVRIVSLKDDQGPRLLIFLHDTTEEKRVEAIKKDFVANVSHELRTPLASIKGYSETLLDSDKEDKETISEFLGIIDKHATRMSRLIDDLLILSKLESHHPPMTTETIDITELVKSTTEGLIKQVRDKGIELTLSSIDEEAVVRADRDRLEQVIVNLLDNAIKYTPSGGKVKASVAVDGDEVRVDVADTGLGIPAEDIPRIFERFYRVDKARSRELGGTGLGLAIVKHIIQKLGGRVDVKSVPGKGSTFSFFLKRL